MEQTLVLDDGNVFPGSAMICGWMDNLGSERSLFPSEPRRWRALRLRGNANGTMAAAGRLFADESRPESERAKGMMVRFAAARDYGLDWLEREPLLVEPEIGEIAVGAMLPL